MDKTIEIEPGVQILYLALNELFGLNEMKSPQKIHLKLLGMGTGIHYAICLCQLYGVEGLNYQFSWTKNAGPVNDPDHGFADLGLGSDLNKLLTGLKIEQGFLNTIKDVSLPLEIKAQLKNVNPLITSYAKMNEYYPDLTQKTWLRLLASVAYLKSISKYSDEKIGIEIKKDMPVHHSLLPRAFAILAPYKLTNPN